MQFLCQHFCIPLYGLLKRDQSDWSAPCNPNSSHCWGHQTYDCHPWNQVTKSNHGFPLSVTAFVFCCLFTSMLPVTVTNMAGNWRLLLTLAKYSIRKAEYRTLWWWITQTLCGQTLSINQRIVLRPRDQLLYFGKILIPLGLMETKFTVVTPEGNHCKKKELHLYCCPSELGRCCICHLTFLNSEFWISSSVSKHACSSFFWGDWSHDRLVCFWGIAISSP